MVGYNTQQLNINNLLSAMAMMVIVVMFFRIVNKMLFSEEQELLPQTEPDITNGVIIRGGQLVANPDNIPAARAFIAELGRQAAEAEAKAEATTEYKARILRQNARQARRDADRIEATIPKNPQTVKYLTIIDAGDTTFKEGEVISPEAYEKENRRVKRLGLRPAFGKHLADILSPRTPQTEPLVAGPYAELTEEQKKKLREVLGLPLDEEEVLRIHRETGYVP